MGFEEQIMSKDKYPSFFSCQMEAIVFSILQTFFATCAISKIGEYSWIFLIIPIMGSSCFLLSDTGFCRAELFPFQLSVEMQLLHSGCSLLFTPSPPTPLTDFYNSQSPV